MVPAPVGQLCPDDAKRGTQEMRRLQQTVPGTGGAPVTYALLAIIGVVFLLDVVSGGELTQRGAESTYLISDKGEWYRLFTAMFLHDRSFLLHILFNGFALWQFGPMIERSLGSVRYLLLYLVSGLLGSALYFALTDPFDPPAVGASGAIFGLFGAYLALAYNRRHTRLGRAQYQSALALLGLNLALPLFVARIAWQAHVGGLIGGILIAVVFDLMPANRRTLATVVGPAIVLGIALVLIGLRMDANSALF
jgi:membrane associated rhomboid family serine protease